MSDTAVLIILFLLLGMFVLTGAAVTIFARQVLAWFMSPKRMWRMGPAYCFDDKRKMYYVEASPRSLWWSSKLGYVCDATQGRVYITPARVQIYILRFAGILLVLASLFVISYLAYLAAYRPFG